MCYRCSLRGSFRLAPNLQAGILAKRKPKTGSPETPQTHQQAIRERVYAPLEEELRGHEPDENRRARTALRSLPAEADPPQAQPRRMRRKLPTRAQHGADFRPRRLPGTQHDWRLRASPVAIADGRGGGRGVRQAPSHVVEAGTGTGKTLAYLIPAIRSGRRVVISTATKSLQEQLFEKDIPFLQKHFAPELKVAVMKGRGNFLCREKVYRMADQPMLKGLDEVDWFPQIRDWEKVTETGDRAELNFLPDDSDLWQRLDARRDACTGSKCPEFNSCFLTAMHQRAAEADLIIVNHHLFFADLALKQDDFGSVLPEYGAVIFDEAHEIEDVASDYFGRQISNYRFDELARDAELAARVTKTGGAHAAAKHVDADARNDRAVFSRRFPPREGRFPFDKASARASSNKTARPTTPW